uniref:Ovule protein n=1 Tax=Strongyloides venezuelensis TaxID=75913 RepID=A0A0K0F1W9_STRVS
MDFEGSRCISSELSEVCFIMTIKERNIPSTECIFCLKCLIWMKDDIPLKEQLRKMPSYQGNSKEKGNRYDR